MTDGLEKRKPLILVAVLVRVPALVIERRSKSKIFEQ